MNRRELLAAITVAGASTLLPTRCIAACNDSRIVVDGLDTSALNEEFLNLLKNAGVDSVHRTSGDLLNYGETHQFLDEHPDKIVLATSVSDIESAKASGKIALTTGTQHANFLEKMLDKSHRATYTPLSPALRVPGDAV